MLFLIVSYRVMTFLYLHHIPDLLLIWKQKEHFQKKSWFVQGSLETQRSVCSGVWILGSLLHLVLGTLNHAYWHLYFFNASMLVWSLSCSSCLPFSSLNPFFSLELPVFPFSPFNFSLSASSIHIMLWLHADSSIIKLTAPLIFEAFWLLWQSQETATLL